MEEYIIFAGEAYTIEWYYADNGKSQPFTFYESLDQKDKLQFLKLVKMMGDIGQIRNKEKFRNEGDKIYAFKPKPNRFLCFFTEGQRIIVTNAFTKKANKLPPREKTKALNHRSDYLERTKKGTYYADDKENDEHP